MYIVKNALKCIGRSKGRNILIGIIALVIAVSACLGLSIRQAAESAKASALEGMSVTASISYDRAAAMNGMSGGGKGSFDRNQFNDLMGSASSLTLEDYLTYAGAASVSDFYYTLTAYCNGTDDFLPVGASDPDTGGELDGTLEEGTASSGAVMGGGKGNMMGGAISIGDFTLIGYSGDNAMTDFQNGVSSIVAEGGAVFEEGTADYVCIISEELAAYNGLSVHDTITVSNINDTDEVYTLTVVGIYSGSADSDLSLAAFGKSQDPANRIYMSATALQGMLDESAAASGTVTDEETGSAAATAMTATLSATYVFSTVEDYYAFEGEARALGLDDAYAVSSTDITAFENSMTPLNTLSKMAGWFLLVILLIGGVILVVLNIFNIRERKYEIGVLTAMGMKKGKVAAQFICEILIVTMVAVVLGAGIGAVTSLPVTNGLLAEQVESAQTQKTQLNAGFGRPGDTGALAGGNLPGAASENRFGAVFGGAANYISEVNSAMNLTVVLQMIGVGLLLTLVASAVSVLFVMRYDPLKILANRD